MIHPSECDIQECSPYNEREFLDGLNRLLHYPALSQMVGALFPETSFEEFLKMAREIRTVDAFQGKIISKAVNALLKKTSDGLSIHGIQHLKSRQKYLFLSNHRDIICDSALLTDSLFQKGFETPQICLGDNLLVNSLIIDLVKMNKGIIVKRNLAIRDLFKWSVTLSHVIRSQIESNSHSVWLAQREGRAKDGNDQTHPGIIKMLGLTGEGTFLQNIESLHIIPVAISYEYDPCDVSKAKELYYRALTGSYQKAPNEDLCSMMNGIQGYKGRIHIELGREISTPKSHQILEKSKKDQLMAIVTEIDKTIHRSYKNWPSNYIAYDLLSGNAKMENYYTKIEKDKFINRMEERLKRLDLAEAEIAGVRHYFLTNYANSVVASVQ